MRILKIEADGFGVYSHMSLSFPETGLVVVSGENGAGKSTIVEIIAACLWKETIREAQLWSKNDALLRVDTDCVKAVRTQKSFSWSALTEQPTVFETTTKAQDSFNKTFFDFTAWRNTCVFSSIDAANFSQATDSIRKKLLEKIFGLEKFDEALKKCRDDLRACTSTLDKLKLELAVVEERISQQDKFISHLSKSSVTPIDKSVVDLSTFNKEEAEKQIDALTLQINDNNTRISACMEAASTARANLKHAKVRSSRLSSAKCPECGQDIALDIRAKLLEAVEDATSDVEATASNAEELKRLQFAVQSNTRSIAELRHKIGMKEKVQALEKKNEASELERVKKLTELTAQRIESGSKKDGILISIENTRLTMLELEAAEEVLGMKGVRARVLSRSIVAINLIANRYLDQICKNGESIEMTLTKNEAISLEVARPFGKTNYKASSQGERRRVDIAIMLAISSVAQSQNGFANSTLFFDEVFDSLDKEGCAKVSNLLKTMSEKKPIVVITHNEDLISHIETTHKWVVSHGSVTVRTEHATI